MAIAGNGIGSGWVRVDLQDSIDHIDDPINQYSGPRVQGVFDAAILRQRGIGDLDDRAGIRRVVDFGIRGLDLTYALLDGYETVILVDAVPRGGAPGTLYLLEPARGEASEIAAASIETHGMDPVKVLRLAEAMGGKVERLLLVGCEPMPDNDYEDMRTGLSDPVRSAVEEAIRLLESLLARLLRGETVEAK